MAYPPPQGAHPYPPNQGNVPPFSAPPQAPGYAPYPPAGAPPTATAGAPYPVSTGPPLQYPLQGSSPYQSQSGFGISTYPQPAVGGSPYPPQPGAGSPYPPQAGAGSPYPPQPGAGSPYPPQPGVASPYPPQAGAVGSPYPPQPVFGASYAPAVSNIVPANAPYHQTTTTAAQAGSMWPYQERPTIRPSPAASFDPNMDASSLRQAMKGFGTDEATIIQILSKRTNFERQRIIQCYQQSYGKELMEKLRSEISGDFLAVVEALMLPLADFLASEIHSAVDRVGTKEHTLIEILCTTDNTTLRAIKASYSDAFGATLESALRSDTSGTFERLLVAMAAANRDEAGMCRTQASSLAQLLYAAGAKRLGTDETEFIRILSSYSYPLLRCVFQEYEKASGGKSFEAALRSELSGSFEDGMLALHACIWNRAAFFARRLHEAMKGAGTRDKALTRILVWRSEVDLGNIKDEYQKAYGRSLEDDIAKETSRDYKKMLLSLLQE